MAEKDSSFSEFLKKSRERKKHEQLAKEIFGDRGRKSHPSGSISNTRKQRGPAHTLASRNGVTKRSASTSAKGNINGRWSHDLHQLNNPRPQSAQAHRASSAVQPHRHDRIRDGLRSTNQDASPTVGFNIKGAGSSGSTTVVATNFAPGTTAADIEAVMAPHGGELKSCRIISSKPTVMVEMEFADSTGAANVVATFNNQKADGRILYVYLKQPPTVYSKPSERPIPKGPRAQFENDAMELDNQEQRVGAFEGRKEPRNLPSRYGFSNQPPRTWQSAPRPGRDGGEPDVFTDPAAPRDRY